MIKNTRVVVHLVSPMTTLHTETRTKKVTFSTPHKNKNKTFEVDGQTDISTHRFATINVNNIKNVRIKLSFDFCLYMNSKLNYLITNLGSGAISG